MNPDISKRSFGEAIEGVEVRIYSAANNVPYPWWMFLCE